MYEPGEVANRLFFTDADGEKTDPESAIAAALQGDWEQLEPEVAALLADESAGAYDRFLALSALARWASPTGYEAVRAAAANPDEQPWRDMSVDRLYSLDNTFALLTESVVNSRDEARERDTSAERLTALAALIGIADRVYLEHNLSPSGLYTGDIEQLRGSIGAQIERGLVELAAAQAPLQASVHDQVEELIDALGLVDKGAADTYKARLNG
ncbi:hypothetical protein N7474_008760 [Penicillium riverlandense]|uniref:uncharacterized protein n=1 Tax=Penicillium riverlandense TaxID=1903569 RepID=UPI002548220C|nr:uncharacterized protein N7474_008760 [Penicillium riverlandense]KAJ5812459.1 hypothetical protein N7474_008760 [Penicillium riverlandense]